jgi:hypothetical protein
VNVGDRVTVVWGFPPDPWVGVVVALADRDGRVSIRPEAADEGYLLVPLVMIDAGAVTVAGAHGYRHRATDPETARLAAESVGVRLTDGQWLVLVALANAGPAGLIDHEHEARNGLEQDSAGKRRLELERFGLAEPTGQRKLTPRGSWADAHRITARGLIVFEQHRKAIA